MIRATNSGDNVSLTLEMICYIMIRATNSGDNVSLTLNDLLHYDTCHK